MRQIPVLTSMKKTRDTPFLKNYTLHYINSEGGEKVYETVSNFDYEDPGQLGQQATGVADLEDHKGGDHDAVGNAVVEQL